LSRCMRTTLRRERPAAVQVTVKNHPRAIAHRRDQA
jgi:hypothetical protein